MRAALHLVFVIACNPTNDMTSLLLLAYDESNEDSSTPGKIRTCLSDTARIVVYCCSVVCTNEVDH